MSDLLWKKEAAQKTAELLEIQNPQHLPIALCGAFFKGVFAEELARLGWTVSDETPFCLVTDETELRKHQPDSQRVIAVAFNTAQEELVYQSLVGDESTLSASGSTARALCRAMEYIGYRAVEERDVKGRWNVGAAGEKDLLYGDILLRQFVKSFKELTDPSWNSVVLVRAFERKKAPKPQNEKRPFLSVLTRTQGNRIQELREVLLCLSAQSCRDFEVVLVGHKVPAELRENVLQLIREVPDYLRDRIRYFSLETGGRTAPLNYGFSQARGKYVAILDDDDIVMSDWVERFREGAQKKPGQLLHAYSVQQPWGRLKDGSLCAIGSCRPIHCKNFEWDKQFIMNNCPPVSLAFPTYAFQELGITFDDTLNVTEDWDYTMRVAIYSGVYDIPVVTSVYRMWESGNSLSLHGQEEWALCYRRITKKMNSIPLLMPSGTVKQLLKKENTNNARGTVAFEEICKLYFPTAVGYDEKDSLQQKNLDISSQLDYIFEVDRTLSGRVRLDPMDQGNMMLENVHVNLEAENGKNIQLGGHDLFSNGYQHENCFLFPEGDPQLYFVLPEPVKVKSLHFFAKCTRGIPVPLQEFILHNENIVSAQFSYRGEKYSGPIAGSYQVRGNEIRCSYDHFASGDHVFELHFAPSLRGGIVVQNFSARAFDPDGVELPLKWRNNGFVRGDADVFLSEPAYGAQTAGKLIATVEIGMTLTGRIPLQTARSFIPRWRRLLSRLRKS